MVWSGFSNLSVGPPCDSSLSGGGGDRKENTLGQDASVLQEEEAQRGLPEETRVSAVPGKKKKKRASAAGVNVSIYHKFTHLLLFILLSLRKLVLMTSWTSQPAGSQR